MKAKFGVLTICTVVSILSAACGNTTQDLDTESVSIEKEETDIVTSSAEDTEVEVTEEPAGKEETNTEPELSEEELEWQNRMMPNVEDALNVRIEPSTEAELAGKLQKGDGATILENDGEWTKIQSGELVGYVKNEYCLYGEEALTYAKENCDTVATVVEEGLRVREETNTESRIIRRLEEGDTLIVDLDTEAEDGWVSVKHEDATYYVSEEYVTVSLEVGTGMTMEEIEEIRRAEAEAKAAEEAAKRAAAAQEVSSQVVSHETTPATTDDLTLLASIIYCEAGGENYDTQLAAGAVIMNRVRSGAFPNNLRDVIYQRGQFGPVKTGKLARVIAQGKATASCYQAAQAALNGADNTGGCLFFNDYNGSRSGLIIGNMVFW